MQESQWHSQAWFVGDEWARNSHFPYLEVKSASKRCVQRCAVCLRQPRTASSFNGIFTRARAPTTTHTSWRAGNHSTTGLRRTSMSTTARDILQTSSSASTPSCSNATNGARRLHQTSRLPKLSRTSTPSDRSTPSSTARSSTASSGATRSAFAAATRDTCRSIVNNSRYHMLSRIISIS